MALRLDANGIGVLIRKIETRAVQQGIQSAGAAGLVLESYLKVELSQPGSGRVYGTHRASAPGEPPAPDSGVLRGSVGIEQIPDGTVRVAVSAPYAVALEFGAPERGLQPRPFFRPALRRALPAMQGAAVEAQLKGVRAVPLAPRDAAINAGFSGS